MNISKKEDSIKKVYDILKNIYNDCNINERTLKEFAEELADYIFLDEYELNEIFIMTSNFESNMREKGVEINYSKEFYVFSSIVDCLEHNEMNAKRVFNSFIDYNDLNLFFDLMTDYREFLTKEEIDEIIEIAKSTFDPTFLYGY